jgi:phage-related protein
MRAKFEIIFLEEAIEFVAELDIKSRKKIYYNIDKSKLINDPKLFEKLEGEIWYFRTKFLSFQYRIFAFWDKTDNKKTLVLATHGVIKKSNKVEKSEIIKAERIRQEYFKYKNH